MNTTKQCENMSAFQKQLMFYLSTVKCFQDIKQRHNVISLIFSVSAGRTRSVICM
jgi:hypothetical protein